MVCWGATFDWPVETTKYVRLMFLGWQLRQAVLPFGISHSLTNSDFQCLASTNLRAVARNTDSN